MYLLIPGISHSTLNDIATFTFHNVSINSSIPGVEYKQK